MRPPMVKMSALVVSAIRSLRETRGSTSKDIMNYIMSEHRAGDAAIQRQLNAALKRGMEYGILRKVNGHYTLNPDPFGVNPYVIIPEEKGMQKRRRHKKGSRRMRKGRRGRGARRSRISRRRGGGHRRTTRKVTMKPERRGILARTKKMSNAKRLKKMEEEDLNEKRPNKVTPPIERMHVDHDLEEDRPTNVEIPRRTSTINNNNNKERERSRSKSRRSQSQPRQQTRQETPPARSPSRSSESSDRDDQDDNRQDD